jgi:RNA polymerase subunit RPABC4/transcription elongation factor Spt4
MTQCPQCARSVDAGSDFCPNCGHYVGWDKTAVQANPVHPPAPGQAPGQATAQAPGQAGEPSTDPAARSLPPQEPRPRPPAAEPEAPPQPVVGPTLVCSACGDVNSASRTYCQRCGERLPTEPPTGPLPVVPPQDQPPSGPYGYQEPPSYRPPRQLNGKVILVVLLAIAMVLIGVIFAVSRGGDKGTSGGGAATGTPPASRTPASTAATELTRVDPGSIQAQASSELPPAGDLTYGIGNTLDGNTQTAWNSNGAQVGTGVGQVLSYRFADRVHLRRIELVNGYAKSDRVFGQNARINAVAITTDSGTIEVSLADSRQSQTVEQDFGVTRGVSLRVLSVYPGSKYPDLGLTEIAFLATPAG